MLSDLWRVDCSVKQVDMPESMLRAMAKQAEAEREKRSKIIHAEGEFSAAQRLVTQPVCWPRSRSYPAPLSADVN
jgi:regulator of protease activity HflC (stomatin/prohibitin superfamily)